MLEVTEWHTDNVSDNGITLQKTRSAQVEDKSVSNASLFTHFNCCSAGSNIILTNSYNLSQNATHTNYSLLWPLFSDRRRSILTRAVFRSLWKNDTGWSWYSDTTSDMTAAETWNPWFYLQARGEKSQGRGGAGCFSGPGLFVSTLAWCLLPRHVDHPTLRVSFQRHLVRYYLP